MTHPATTPGDSFSPAPASFPPPPRAVRLRSIPFAGGSVILFLAVLALGLFPLTSLPFLLITAGRHVGAEAVGEITDKQARGRRHVDRVVLFRFELDGATCHAEVHVDPQSYSDVKIGDAIKVRALSVWPSYSASIVEPYIETPSNVWVIGCIVLVLNGALVMVVVMLVGRSLYRRRIARLGNVTLGRITYKEVIRKSKNHIYRLTFTYSTPAIPADTTRNGTMDVTAKEYNTMSVGQAVTVLYDPAKPEDSYLYCFGEYRIVGL
jgi:Protein of unknown function (DUF3592)